MKKVAFVVCLANLGLCFACGGDSDDGDACAPVQPCGGDIVGRWEVQSVCADKEQITAEAVSELPAECADAVQGVEADADGLVLEFTASGASNATGRLVAQVDYTLSQACLNAVASMSVRVSSLTCALVGSTIEDQLQADDPQATATCSQSGDSCACATSFNAAPGGETYSIQGTRLIQGTDSQDYCVSGDSLGVSAPQGTYRARRAR